MGQLSQSRRRYLRSVIGGAALVGGSLTVDSAVAQTQSCDVTVDSGGGGDFTTIQAAIDDAGTTDGDTICVEPGTYDEQVTLDKEVTLVGDGSGENAAQNTILDGNGGDGINIQADNVTIEGVRITGFSNGISFGQSVSDTMLRDVTATDNAPRGIEVHNQSTLTNLTLDRVTLTNQEDGLRVSTDGAIHGLTISDSAIDDNDIGLEVYTANTDPSSGNLTDVTIKNTTFNENSRKGIYTETLSNAVLQGLTIENSGTNSDYRFNAGIDINLKYGDYQDITISDTTVTGVTEGDPPNDRFPVGITIKARQDGSTYGGNPATLSGVTLNGLVVRDNPNGIRFGEPDKSAYGLQDASVTGSNIEENDVYGLNNEVDVEVDGTDNWWGHASGPGGPDGRRNPAGREVGKGDDITGDVTFDPWLRRPIDSPSR